MNAQDLYADLARHLPNATGIGGALISLVEPHLGHEVSYNRYYEDDHYYSAAMVGPWVFAGKRWVATRDLQLLRFPESSPVLQPVTAGCYLATYLHSTGHHGDVIRWGTANMHDHLYPQGRGYDSRENVFASYSTYEFGVTRDQDRPLKPIHALNFPFVGIVLESLQPRETCDRVQLLRELESRTIPSLISDLPARLALAFTPQPFLEAVVPNIRPVQGPGQNLTILWFLDVDPRACWSIFREHTAAFGAVGVDLALAAPFIPTVPGTDLYVDQLR